MSTTFTPSSYLTQISQIRQFFSSISLMFNSICERTDSAFRRVYVMKKDEQGNIKSYNIKDKITGETRKIFVIPYIEDIKNGNLQLDEPAHVIAVKCALLTFAIPFYTAGKMALHMFKTPLEISALAIDTLKKTGEQLMMERFYEASIEMGRSCNQAAEMFGDGLFEIIRAPIFGLGAELVSIYGIFKPYHGRKIEAIIEHSWQKGASYKDDFRNAPSHAEEAWWEAFMKDLHNIRTFYLAYCFQVRGNVNGPRIVVIRREALNQWR